MAKKLEMMDYKDLRELSLKKNKIGVATPAAREAQEELYRRRFSDGGTDPISWMMGDELHEGRQ